MCQRECPGPVWLCGGWHSHVQAVPPPLGSEPVTEEAHQPACVETVPQPVVNLSKFEKIMTYLTI